MHRGLERSHSATLTDTSSELGGGVAFGNRAQSLCSLQNPEILFPQPRRAGSQVPHRAILPKPPAADMLGTSPNSKAAIKDLERIPEAKMHDTLVERHDLEILRGENPMGKDAIFRVGSHAPFTFSPVSNRSSLHRNETVPVLEQV